MLTCMGWGQPLKHDKEDKGNQRLVAAALPLGWPEEALALEEGFWDFLAFLAAAWPCILAWSACLALAKERLSHLGSHALIISSSSSIARAMRYWLVCVQTCGRQSTLHTKKILVCV